MTNRITARFYNLNIYLQKIFLKDRNNSKGNLPERRTKKTKKKQRKYKNQRTNSTNLVPN